MNLEHWSPGDLAALRVLYDSGQSWSWSEIDAGQTPRGNRVRRWIETGPPPRRYPLVLPVCREDATDAQWLAVAFSESQAEALREQLNAFVGAAGTDYDGRRADLRPDDPLDRAVTDWIGGPWAFRFSALPTHRDGVREALARLRRLWTLQPPLRTSVYRHPEALLREFFSALANGDEPAATHWLEEIRESGRFGFDNLFFLEVEFLSAFRHWQRLARHPRLHMLVDIRRPRRITALLVEALWRTELAQFATVSQVDAALDYARTRFLPRYAGLLRARGSLGQPPVVLAFLLAAAALNPPRWEQIPALLAALPADAPERPFAEAIAARAMPAPPPPAEPDDLALAGTAIRREDFDTAWSHLQKTPASFDSCEMRFTCFDELLDPEAARQIFEAVNALSLEERNRLLQTRRRLRIWDDIQAQLATPTHPVPTDWETWLTAVEQHSGWDQALVTAHEGAQQWNLAVYEQNPARVQGLAARLEATRDPTADQRLRLALPHLIRFFLPDQSARPVFLPLYVGLLMRLALDDHFGGEDWSTSQTVAMAILEAGASAVEYTDLADAITALWEARGEVARMDWALDLLDAFVVAPVLAATKRDAFYTAVWNTFNANARRVRGRHRELFSLLSGDLGREADFNALPAAPPAANATLDATDRPLSLRGRTVAIYTLEEAAGQRARTLIESLYEGADVRLSHDYVGSDRLRSLARDADYFVIASRSAKHAATDFIKQVRPPQRQEVIYAAGKGSSSLLSALQEALAEAG